MYKHPNAKKDSQLVITWLERYCPMAIPEPDKLDEAHRAMPTLQLFLAKQDIDNHSFLFAELSSILPTSAREHAEHQIFYCCTPIIIMSFGCVLRNCTYGFSLYHPAALI